MLTVNPLASDKLADWPVKTNEPFEAVMFLLTPIDALCPLRTNEPLSSERINAFFKSTD